MPTPKKKPAPRQGVRVNYGNIPGTFMTVPVGESTHLYAAETLDGKNWFAFPTLFQDPDGTWVDMSEYHEKGDWLPVYEEAKRRGEVIDFGENKEEAIRFGEGSWKDKEMSSGGAVRIRKKVMPSAVKVSVEGYRRFSPDEGNDYNIIESNRISMRDVEYPVVGIDNHGNVKVMFPEREYRFTGSRVLEIPVRRVSNMNESDIKSMAVRVAKDMGFLK